MSFDDQKLRARIRSALDEQKLKDDKREEIRKLMLSAKGLPGPSDSFWTRLVRFWNGTTEMPAPVGLLMVLTLCVSAWGLYGYIFVVDQSIALLMLQAGEDSARIVSQGVTVI